MAKTKDTLYTQFFGGIADFKRLGIAGSYASGRSVDVRSDPRDRDWETLYMLD